MGVREKQDQLAIKRLITIQTNTIELRNIMKTQ